MESESIKGSMEQKLGKLPCFLAYAVIEWVLIILLFIDGLIVFVTNEFARYFGLRIPCLLCTRIDHVLVHRDPGFYYNDSICEVHRKNVSSLAYCHVHQRLSDIRMMCEGCLLSFATENKSNSETYQSLVGILGADLECSVEDDHKIHLRLPAEEKNVQAEKSDIHRCSCCGEPLRMKPSFQHGMKQVPGSNKSLLSQVHSPSPRRKLMAKKEESNALVGGCNERKHMPETDFDSPKIDGNENRSRANGPSLAEGDDFNEDFCKTPSYIRANRLFRFAFDETNTASPRNQTILKQSPAENAEQGVETFEVATTEADNEGVPRQLRRQLRVDRKTLIAIYMELDEERNASAIAANQAMAMITRLQEEKAALQMEALQYQRMMEEQAEYDEEAMQLLKEDLMNKEEEIRELKGEYDIDEMQDSEYEEGADFEEEDLVQVDEDAGGDNLR
ncbi:hypothetical protein Sjap_023748 [Stephania japonica]|uniref:GTD-binding domain-containing protein n=1 Tax=Stephania japonica TaxID=461633 RepID=A0AAP0HN97_9MAGN